MKEVHTMVLGPEVGNPAAAIAAKMNELRRPPMTPEQREAAFEAAKAKLHPLLDAQRHEEALVAFDECLAIALSPHMLLAKGMHLRAMGRLPAAVACLDDALSIDPDLIDAWFWKADMLESLNHLPQSLAAYDKVLAANSHHAQAWCDRGHVLNRMGRVPDALRSYESALAIDATSLHAWFNKASAEAVLGHRARARESFGRFLELNPPPKMAPQVHHAREMLTKLA